MRNTLLGGGAPGDRGAVAVLVAVLLSGGVLLGMAALTVDVGLLYAEREELQSGADAAAVAVAKACVERSWECEKSRARTLAERYARSNASDGYADVEVCGRVPAPPFWPGPWWLPGWHRIDECDSDGGAVGNLTDCLRTPPADASKPYIQVRTSTRRPSGSTALPPAFAGAVTGGDGVTVGACSLVTWSWRGSGGEGTAIAVSLCARNRAVTSAHPLQPPPVSDRHDPDVDPDAEVALHFREPDLTTPGCEASGGATHDGFSRLDYDTDDCTTTYGMPREYKEAFSRAGDFPGECYYPLYRSRTDLEEITFAVFDDVQRTASPPRLRVAFLATFVVTGYHFFDGEKTYEDESNLTGAKYCEDLREACIYGYFTYSRTGGPYGGSIQIETIG